MSLSHQNVISVSRRFKADTEGLPCPECGNETLSWVNGDCELLDGTIVPDVERIQCSSCGGKLFDLPAMRQIREYRESQNLNKTSKSRIRKQKFEKTYA